MKFLTISLLISAKKMFFFLYTSSLRGSCQYCACTTLNCSHLISFSTRPRFLDSGPICPHLEGFSNRVADNGITGAIRQTIDSLMLTSDYKHIVGEGDSPTGNEVLHRRRRASLCNGPSAKRPLPR